jgi:hypothetical protein
MIPWDVRNSQALALPDLPSMRKLMLSVTARNILLADNKAQSFESVLSAQAVRCTLRVNQLASDAIP